MGVQQAQSVAPRRCPISKRFLPSILLGFPSQYILGLRPAQGLLLEGLQAASRPPEEPWRVDTGLSYCLKDQRSLGPLKAWPLALPCLTSCCPRQGILTGLSPSWLWEVEGSADPQRRSSGKVRGGSTEAGSAEKHRCPGGGVEARQVRRKGRGEEQNTSRNGRSALLL